MQILNADPNQLPVPDRKIPARKGRDGTGGISSNSVNQFKKQRRDLAMGGAVGMVRNQNQGRLAAPNENLREVFRHADVGGQGGEFLAFERQ